MGAGVAPKFESKEFTTARQKAADRLRPSLTSPSYLELRARRIRMQEFFSRKADWGDVLDVGAQYCPYFPFFENRCRSYTSLDVVETPIVDIVCDAENMSLPDSSYDLVICTQVLEHTQRPQKIVDECTGYAAGRNIPAQRPVNISRSRISRGQLALHAAGT